MVSLSFQLISLFIHFLSHSFTFYLIYTYILQNLYCIYTFSIFLFFFYHLYSLISPSKSVSHQYCIISSSKHFKLLSFFLISVLRYIMHLLFVINKGTLTQELSSILVKFLQLFLDLLCRYLTMYIQCNKFHNECCQSPVTPVQFSVESFLFHFISFCPCSFWL